MTGGGVTEGLSYAIKQRVRAEGRAAETHGAALGAISVCVLFVEDEFLIREIMAESLEDAGFAVVQAATGDEAIAVIAQSPVTFTALVTDFHMPGKADGADVASRIRERWPGMPVVIVSGRPDVLQASWEEQNGYRLITKPYGPRQLIGVLKELMLAA